MVSFNVPNLIAELILNTINRLMLELRHQINK